MSDNVISLASARQRMNERDRPPNPILEALDALGLALADHGHQWSEKEAALYETAVAYAQSMTAKP